jgi:hypothetical protein
MADATGTVTTNYGFKTLAGDDTAGYTSINSVITSIDTQLDDKMFITGMVIMYQGVAAPSGWTLDTTSGLPTKPASYVWIKKN